MKREGGRESQICKCCTFGFSRSLTLSLSYVLSLSLSLSLTCLSFLTLPLTDSVGCDEAHAVVGRSLTWIWFFPSFVTVVVVKRSKSAGRKVDTKSRDRKKSTRFRITFVHFNLQKLTRFWPSSVI